MMLPLSSLILRKWIFAGGFFVVCVNACATESSDLTTLTGRIASYSVATRVPRQLDSMFGVVGALIGRRLQDGQWGGDTDFRIYDVQTEAGRTLHVVSRDEFEGNPCVEVTAPAKALEKGFVALGTAQLRVVANCAELKPIPPFSETDIRQKPGRPN
jgi:hypothetical protein